MNFYFDIAFLLLLVAYTSFIMLIIRGIGKSAKLTFEESSSSVSILVPMRNEELNIVLLLNSIRENKYPKSLIEIIVVDDHSTDESRVLVLEWRTQNPTVQLKLIDVPETGKKAAIQEGLKYCTYDIILQTDADCVVPKNWIKSLSNPLKNKAVKLVAGPVGIDSNGTLFQELQKIEFASLIASSIGLSNNGIHIMANAANMAFKKSARQAFDFNEKSESGDDVFFLQKLAAKDKSSIVYLSDNVVKTSAKATFYDFKQQRLRWASKTSKYPNKMGIWIALFVFIINIVTLFSLLYIFIAPILSIVFLSMRFLLDGILLNRFYKRVLKEKMIWKTFFIQSLLNPIYILFIAISSQVVQIYWKGRKV